MVGEGKGDVRLGRSTGTTFIGRGGFGTKGRKNPVFEKYQLSRIQLLLDEI